MSLPFTKNQVQLPGMLWGGMGVPTPLALPKSPFSMDLCHPPLLPSCQAWLCPSPTAKLQFCSVQSEPDGNWAGSSLLYLGVPLSFHSCSSKGMFPLELRAASK